MLYQHKVVVGAALPNEGALVPIHQGVEHGGQPCCQRLHHQLSEDMYQADRPIVTQGGRIRVFGKQGEWVIRAR